MPAKSSDPCHMRYVNVIAAAAAAAAAVLAVAQQPRTVDESIGFEIVACLMCCDPKKANQIRDSLLCS